MQGMLSRCTERQSAVIASEEQQDVSMAEVDAVSLTFESDLSGFPNAFVM